MNLSFIIPAHNSQDTLQRAVESILISGRQSELDFEVIIVENASEDQTQQLAQQLAQDNQNVRVIVSDQKGVSNARNLGIKEATGKYILFVDADDYLLETGIGEIENFLRSYPETDLGVFSYEVGNSEYLVSSQSTIYDKNVLEFKEYMLKNPTKFMTVWAKLLKRSLIIDNALIFNPDLRLAEDGDFMLQYLTHCRKIVATPHIFYHYSTDNSQSAVRKFDGKKAQDYQKALTVSQNYLRQNAPELLDAYNYYILMHLNVIMVREVFAKNNGLSYFSKLKQSKEIAHKNIFLSALKSIEIVECRTPRLLSILLIKMHCFILASFIFKLRVRQNLRSIKGEKNESFNGNFDL